jgi:hypothetical protein
VVKIDASANTDLVHALEVGHLAGNLIIQLAPGDYTASTAYSLLTCDEGFTSPFDNAYFDIPGEGLQSISNASLNYTSDSVILIITDNFTVNAPMGFASLQAVQKKPPVVMTTTPVNDLFKWTVRHKKPPKENVQLVVKNYTQALKNKVKRIK